MNILECHISLARRQRYMTVLCLVAYLGGAQDGEHEGQARVHQLQTVVLLPDGGELSEQREGDPRAGLLLGAAQRLQPHVQLPRHACGEQKRYIPRFSQVSQLSTLRSSSQMTEIV